MSKLNHIKILIIIFLIVTFVSYLTYYKFYNINKDIYEIELDDNSKINNKILYVEKYNDNIIKDINKEYSYEFIYMDETITWKIFIDNDECIYIFDENLNQMHKINDVKYKTLYKPYAENVIYAISNDNKLYEIYFYNQNISDVQINSLLNDKNIVNFTDIEIKSHLNLLNEIVVLSDDSNMYSSYGNVLYQEDMLYIYGNYYLTNDNKIMSNDLIILNDKNNNEYKVKQIIDVKIENNPFPYLPTKVLITDDNKIICMYGTYKIYEYKKGFKSIRKEEKNDGNIYEITFNDNKKITFKGFEDI